MPFALSAIWKIYEPIGAVLAPMLLAMLIGLWVEKGIEINGLKGQISELHCEIDGPTTVPLCKMNGYRAVISRISANLAIAHDSITQLNGVVAFQKNQIESLSAASEDLIKKTKALQLANTAAAARVQGITAQLQALKPQMGNYGDLVDLIRKKTP